jgi:hypothetical protein
MMECGNLYGHDSSRPDLSIDSSKNLFYTCYVSHNNQIFKVFVPMSCIKL